MASRVLSHRERLPNERRTPYLSAVDRHQVAALLARLEANCAEDVRRVILYGSKARGDAVFESDIDLVIVARDDVDRIKRAVKAFEREEEHWAEPQVFSREDWNNYRRLRWPYYVNVRRDGIELWDEEAQRSEELQVPLDFAEGTFRARDYETLESFSTGLGVTPLTCP
jgi:predicted nucleotidyltransferase